VVKVSLLTANKKLFSLLPICLRTSRRDEDKWWELTRLKATLRQLRCYVMDSGMQQLSTLSHRPRRPLWPPRAPCYCVSFEVENVVWRGREWKQEGRAHCAFETTRPLLVFPFTALTRPGESLLALAPRVVPSLLHAPSARPLHCRGRSPQNLFVASLSFLLTPPLSNVDIRGTRGGWRCSFREMSSHCHASAAPSAGSGGGM